MSLMYNTVIDSYSIALLIIVSIHGLKHHDKSLQYKLYMMMTRITIFSLLMDIFSRFDGRPETIFPVVNRFGNFMLFLINPIIPCLWLLYVHLQVNRDESRTKRMIYPVSAIFAANALLLVLSEPFGWLYYIDSNNIYHRGPYFLLSTLAAQVLIFASFILILKNRGKVDTKHYYSLLFFMILPCACIVLQIVLYGFSLVLNSVVLSLLVVYLNIQNHGMYTDYLTGIYNRKKLELVLKEKIGSTGKVNSFSVIMADLDDFKQINDTYGHETGDRAIQIAAKLLGSCIRANDFIARYGGDEFYLVLDIKDRARLEEVVDRIRNCTKTYNKSGEQPFKLSFSMGYAVYDPDSHPESEDFQKLIDQLMYENKRAFKEG